MTFPGGSKTVVIVGRNDKTKRSGTILQIAENLRSRGYTLHEFESDRSRISRMITERMARKWPRFAGDPKQLRAHWRLLYLAVKSFLVLKSRRRWDFVQAALRSTPVEAARELNHFLNQLPAGCACLITHSAGGIAATKAAVMASPASSRIARIVCFGYPFKHPDHGPETYRTRHLPSVPCPLLIVQGTDDPYGSDPARFGAYLPADARIAMFDCGHDYNGLPPAEFDRAWATVAEFLSA